MSYNIIIDRFIHPFIIYVVAGTLISYLLALLMTRIPGLRDAKSRARLYAIPFIIPILAYLVFKPFWDYNCIIYKRPWGQISEWLCSGATAIATVLTPLFFLVTALALLKAGLSIIASRRIIIKYGYASPEEYPKLFGLLAKLCTQSGLEVPKIIVTEDSFARSFTMGRRFPVIVLSEGVLNALDDEELETVLAHELGHIVRADSVLNWVMVFLRDFMFFTPLSYWIFRDLSTEKEQAADDFAVQLTGKPYAFAQALIKVWRLSPRTLYNNIVFDNFMPHPSFINSSGIIEKRVQRILNKEHKTPSNPLLSLAAVATSGVFSLFAVYWFC